MAYTLLTFHTNPDSASESTASELHAPRPASAYAFLNSVGVNTHLFYSDTPYRRIDEIAFRLVQLGILHIRDGLAPVRPDEVAALNSLAADGIKADLLIGQPGSNPIPLLRVVKNELSGAVDAIEGPNEYWSQGLGWQARLIPFQQSLYYDVHLVLPGVPVVGASVGSLDLVGSLDVGNIHPYPGGDEPEANLGWQERRAETKVSGAAPIWATETGYHDAVHMLPGSTRQPPTTDAAQSIYVPRLFAYYFAHGVQRTYLYELLDEFRDPDHSRPQDDFGLLNHNLTPKPQFYALENLISAIHDEPNAHPAALRYTISNPGTQLQQLLLSRSDGTWQLLLWRAEPVNTLGKGRYRAEVGLQLPFCSTTTVETPSTSNARAWRSSRRKVDLDIGAALKIVSIRRTSGCETARRR